jgi:hypothetical protein
MYKIIKKITTFFKSLFNKKEKIKEIPKEEVKRLVYTKRTN